MYGGVNLSSAPPQVACLKPPRRAEGSARLLFNFDEKIRELVEHLFCRTVNYAAVDFFGIANFLKPFAKFWRMGWIFRYLSGFFTDKILEKNLFG